MPGKMTTVRQEVYIAGVGMTVFGKREESLSDLILEAAGRAIVDAGFDDFDAVYVGAMHPEGFQHTSNLASVITDYLGFVPAPTMRIETASSTGAALFVAGWHAVASEDHERVLVVAGEVMTRVSTARSTTLMSEVIDADERAHGATMPALAALVTRRYMRQYGLTKEELGLVAIKNHKNAVANPYAHFRKEITMEEYLAAKPIADPLGLYDCAPISDGAAAIVLTKHRRPIRVAGVGQATDFVALSNREDLVHFRSTQEAARRAFAQAGITPRDIGAAEIHDAFTTFEVIGLEDIGFVPPGGGRRATAEGWTAPDGKIPVNRSGGLKARGHPVGTSGLAQIVELVKQMRGEAEYPHEPMRWGLAHSIGGLATNNLVTIFESSEVEAA